MSKQFDVTHTTITTEVSGYGLDLEETFVPEQNKVTTGAALDLDGHEEVVEPALGEHTVRVESWENVPEQWIEPNDGKEHSREQIRHIDAHVELLLRDRQSKLLYRKNIYSASLNGFLKSLNRQANGGLGGMKATACINYYKKNDLRVWAVWNAEEKRTEVYFFDLEGYRKAQAERAKKAEKPTVK